HGSLIRTPASQPPRVRAAPQAFTGSLAPIILVVATRMIPDPCCLRAAGVLSCALTCGNATPQNRRCRPSSARPSLGYAFNPCATAGNSPQDAVNGQTSQRRAHRPTGNPKL